MQQIAPVGPVYQAGTLSGNPLSVAAGLATLRALAATCRTPTTVSRSSGARAEAGAPRGAGGAGRPGLREPGRLDADALPRRRARCATSAAPRRADTEALRALLPRHAGRGRLPASVAVRGHVPLAGAHRGRHRPSRRGGPPGPRRVADAWPHRPPRSATAAVWRRGVRVHGHDRGRRLHRLVPRRPSRHGRPGARSSDAAGRRRRHSSASSRCSGGSSGSTMAPER